jgi:signal transduction histidine kinase/ligand-binding sensor domain-containing protein
MKRTLVLVLLCGMASLTLHAQKRAPAVPGAEGSQDDAVTRLEPPPAPTFAETTHTFWSRRDGAPGGISSLAQTKDGYLWIGSTLGLYRFDGLKFARYPFGPNNPPLPSLDISSLSADLEGGVWISFRNTAILHLKVDGGRTLYGASSGLVANMMEKVVARPDGSVFAFGGGKLFRLEGDRWIDFGKRHGIGRGGVFSLFFDRDGNIWIGRDKKLAVLRKSAAQFTVDPTPVHYVSSMAQSRTGELWITDAWRSVRPLSDTSPQGVLHIQGKAEMLLDSRDDLWIAQDDEGLSRIREISTLQGTATVERSGTTDLSAPRTHALLEDSDGNMWVGTDRGLDRFQETAFVHYRGTQLRYFPSLVAGDDGSIWINSHGTSLMRVFDGTTTMVGEHVNTGPLTKRRNGDICFVDATTYELQCYGHGPGTHVPVADAVNRDPPINMTEDIDGSLLIGFQGKHLWKYKDGSWDPVVAPGLPAEDPWGMLSDSQGRLWLGYGDDRIVERKGGVYRTLHVEGDPWSNTLTFYEAAGTIWAAGSNGVCFFDGERFRRVHALESRLLQGTSGIVLDRSGDLWLNAGAGVLRLSADEVARVLKDPDHPAKIDVFDENDGLTGQPTQFKRTPSAISDARGTLWFATGGDLVSLDPSKLRRTRTSPSVLIESVLVDGKPALSAPGVAGAVLRTSASRLHDLEIGYIGISLSAPERVYYRYRLLGEESEWQDAGSRRQAFYTRLRPGSYQFQVSASNGQGWSDLAVPFQIDVRPAFYQTLWFRVLAIVSIAALAFLYFRMRVLRATEQVRVRLSERLAERERVARELHDTLLQGFQGLMLRFHLATQSIPLEEQARPEMEEALDCADQLLIESRDRIRDLRYETLDSSSLSAALTTLGEEFNLRYSSSFRLEIKGTPRDLNPVSYQEIYAVAKEALVNAIRHSGGSHIRAELSFDATRLRVCIRDDGKGIDASILNGKRRANHWGLTGMYERAVDLKADLRIASPPGEGTEVTLSVPAGVAYHRPSRKSSLQNLYGRWVAALAKTEPKRST